MENSDEQESVFGRSPPPRASDVLFKGMSEDWPLNACISHWGNVGYAYKAGFRKAAQNLTVQMCERPVDQDLMLYPIVYLYRHHVELTLKDIFRYAAALLDHQASGEEIEALGRHGLTQLWDAVQPMLKPVCELAEESVLPIEDIDGISSYIRQISEHDPDGQRFRYATVKRKKPNAPKGTVEQVRSLNAKLTHVNIRNFAIHLEKLADYLDGLECWISDLYQQKCAVEFDRTP